MRTISAVFRGETVTLQMDRWMFAEQRRLSKWLGMTQPEWGEAFGDQRPDAIAFFIYVALHRAGQAPQIDTAAEFTAWWESDDFDFDLASLNVTHTDSDAPEGEPEDESHLPTISAGQP